MGSPFIYLFYYNIGLDITQSYLLKFFLDIQEDDNFPINYL